MNDWWTWSRREVVAELLAIAAGLFVHPASARGAARQPFSDPAAAARVGRAYLAGRPDEADPAVLARRLRWNRAAVSSSGWRRGFDALRRADFAADRVVEIDGWVLAASEARLCALVTLAAESSGLLGKRRRDW